MDDRLAKLRSQLKEQRANTDNKGSGAVDKRYFRFYEAKPGQTSTLRFIDDHPDAKNSFFWEEKQMFRWKFPDPDKPGEMMNVTMPCRNMYVPRTCSISQAISKVYDTNPAAKGMWVNKSYLFEGFVRKTDLEETDIPENPLRLFDMSKNIYGLIYNAITDEGDETALPTWPTNEKGGLNFIVSTTSQGEHNNYSTSKFSSKTTDLTDDELAAIAQYGRYNLKTLLPAQPSDDAFEVQALIGQALLAGDPWNKDWEEYWKPFRKSQKSEESSDGNSEPAPRPAVVTKPKAVEESNAAPKETSSDGNASSILARLKAKKAAAEAVE